MSLLNTSLPEDAKGELIQADQPLNKSRGNLNWWVLVIMLGMILSLSIAYNTHLLGQIDEYKAGNVILINKNNALQDTITGILRQQIDELRPARQAATNAELKTDSLIQRASP